MTQARRNKIFVYFLIVATLALWIGSKWYFNDWFIDDPLKYPAKGGSLVATVLMGFTIVLSTRLKILEKLFGGLDKIYDLHKMVGRYAYMFILAHPIALSLRALPGFESYIRFWGLQSTDSYYTIGASVGHMTFWIMTILIALSLWFKLPYHIWKKTHEYFGVVYIFAALHIILVHADIPKYPFLFIWMYGWLAAGIVAFIYIRFLYWIAGPRHEYVVTNVELQQDNIEICMMPKDPNKPLRYKPSQFIYSRFVSNAVPGEMHPYSIASAPQDDGFVKLGIKKLGDYTAKLCNVQEGEKVYLYGPYGTLSEKFLDAGDDCVFIGGGIGITPCLGMWDMALNSDERVSLDPETKLVSVSDDNVQKWKSPRTHLFYVVKNMDDASFDNDIIKSAIKGQFNGFEDYQKRGHSYTLHNSEKAGRINAQIIADKVGDIQHKQIFMCGPDGMTSALIKQFKEMGVDPNRIHKENFNMVNQKFQIPGLARRTKL